MLAGWLDVPFLCPLVPWLYAWPPGGSGGASVWVVGGCCIRGGFSCGGRLAALLLQCRAVGLRLGPTSCSKKATYQPAF